MVYCKHKNKKNQKPFKLYDTDCKNNVWYLNFKRDDSLSLIKSIHHTIAANYLCVFSPSDEASLPKF